MTISNKSFGTAPNGEDTTLWTISSDSGLSIGITDWGATLVSLRQPGRDGSVAEVTLGFGDASEYIFGKGYLGATCGRFANRIAKGRFVLDSVEYELACNNGPNHLHGGDQGFNARMWQGIPYSEGNRCGVVFTYVSPDGEENYPGEVSLQADYALDDAGRLYMDFHGRTDKATIINITNHAYWNLAGRDSGSVESHILKLYCSQYLPVDATAIPTGELAQVLDTPFDFLNPKAMGAQLNEVAGGYDHCMVIDGMPGELRIAAEVWEEQSGRRMTLHTDRPGVQFYSGNFLSGRPYPKHAGFCLEPEDFPDAPNQPNFPSVVLRPGEYYHHRSLFEFSTF